MFQKIRKYLPDADYLRQHPHIERFGNKIQHSPIWHVNRQSASWGMSVGIFFAFLPIPFRTLPVILASIASGGNLPLAIACIWVFNHVLLSPVFYYAYKFGQYLLRAPADNSSLVSFNFANLLELLIVAWQPLMLGSVIMACAAAFISYWLTRAFWRYRIVRRWRKRQNNR